MNRKEGTNLHSLGDRERSGIDFTTRSARATHVKMPRADIHPPEPDPIPRSPGALQRWANRLAAVIVAGLAAAALYVFVARPVLRADDPVQSVPIDRPQNIPARIPAWAWELHKWHLRSVGERGSRPDAAPQRVPGWYWDFRRWRISLAPAQ